MTLRPSWRPEKHTHGYDSGLYAPKQALHGDTGAIARFPPLRHGCPGAYPVNSRVRRPGRTLGDLWPIIPETHHGRARPSQWSRLANATTIGPRGPLGYYQATRPFGTTICPNSLAFHGSPLGRPSLLWFATGYATYTMSTGVSQNSRPFTATQLSPIWKLHYGNATIAKFRVGTNGHCSGSSDTDDGA